LGVSVAAATTEERLEITLNKEDKAANGLVDREPEGV
jgi:hypothetical protein